MALSTFDGKYLHWTAEEDAVLVQEWNNSSHASGKANDGVFIRLAEIFPHRTLIALKHRKNRLVKAGKVPRLRLRNKYQPLSLSPTEAAWLCAIFEGEGSIADFMCKDPRYPHRAPRRNIRLVVCYNSDEGIMAKVKSLIPHSYIRISVSGTIGTDKRGINTRRNVKKACLASFFPMVEFLKVTLPYMAHTDKKRKCLRALEYMETRIA